MQLFNKIGLSHNSGACGTIIGHPFDTIKTWQQTGNRRIATSVYDIVIRNNGVGITFSLVRNGISMGNYANVSIISH